MKTLSVIVLLSSLSFGSTFHRGLLAGAEKDLESAGKFVTYPVRHPRKSAHGLYAAAKATGKAAKAVLKSAAQL